MYSSIREYIVRLHIRCLWWMLATLGVWAALLLVHAFTAVDFLIITHAISVHITMGLVAIIITAALIVRRQSLRQQVAAHATLVQRLTVYHRWIRAIGRSAFVYGALLSLAYWTTLYPELAGHAGWILLWWLWGWPSAPRAAAFLRLKGAERDAILG